MNLESMCSQILEDNPEIQEWCGVGLSLQIELVKLDDTQRDALDNIPIYE